MVFMRKSCKCKTLPVIARVVGLSNEQGLLHFITEYSGKIEQLRQQRLRLILQVLTDR